MSLPEIITLGCRLNAFESEVMRDHAAAAGLNDAIIVNTCTVTREAERQARQTVRKQRRLNPNAKIIVTGCAAQMDPDAFAAMPEVDHVIGNDEKMKAETFMRLGNHPQVILFRVSTAAPVPSFRCNRAAITAARSASSRSRAAPTVRCRWVRSSSRRARWWRPASRKSC
jgi:tRNA A37 methylthiotransferase MiaB